MTPTLRDRLWWRIERPRPDPIEWRLVLRIWAWLRTAGNHDRPSDRGF